MIPAFVIHHDSCVDRKPLVQDIVKKTGANIVQSVLLPNGKDGCRITHLKVALIARNLYPDNTYLVFEDDCVLAENWKEALQEAKYADVGYLGYNDRSSSVIYGTHAVWITPKARDIILRDAEFVKDQVIDKGAYDHILSLICLKNNLSVWSPPIEKKDQWAVQKKGLKSLITGRDR